MQRDVAYKVWLAKSFTEGNEKAEVTKADIKQLSKVDTGGIRFDDSDVFRKLLIGAAVELGNQKI